MFEITIFIILLRCLSFMESVNSETLRNSDSNDNDYMDFLKLYKLIRQQQQLKNQPKQIINNIYIIPMPLLIPEVNFNYDKPIKNRQLFGENIETAYRDLEGMPVLDKPAPSQNNTNNNNNNNINNKQPQVLHKFAKSNARRVPFEPSKHRNWYLISRSCGQGSTSDRITGGKNASLGQYPWMARIGFINMHENKSVPIFRCGGSLITRYHVITAAHCVIYLPSELTIGIIRLGEFNTDTSIDCERNRCANKVVDVKPKTITVHENYGTPNARNDIAIILLLNSVTFTEWITPICLPFGDLMTSDYTNQRGEVAGWGFYDISINKGSSILQTVQLPILKIQPCAKAFRGIQIHYKKQLCVGGDLGKDSCNGDSGGPLMKVVSINSKPKYVLLGIVSLGAKYCGLTIAPAIYTKITYYMEWILDHLK